MLTRIKTASLLGVSGYQVVVEIDIQRGMPAFNVVGLADTTIKEATRRIKPAIINSGYNFPQERVTINLVPAARAKEGSHFDLPMALGIILSYLEYDAPEDIAYFGELSLDGRINHIRGALPLAMSIRKEGIKTIVLPRSNAEEVSVLRDMRIIPVETLEDVMTYFFNPKTIKFYEATGQRTKHVETLDYMQVIGHESIKRALVVAAAGQHGVMLMGGPGCGKTMMARRLPTIMPPLTYDEQLEITGIYSIAGLLDENHGIVRARPFRSPHTTISAVGLTGGGSGKPRPGELTLAHGGVLFLDELGEFDNKAIDAMRQPLEEGVVRINRNTEEIILPSRCLVIVASNPCKCGNLWDSNKVCTCTNRQIESHRRKLCGPFADRIDMHIKMNPVSKEFIESGLGTKGESSEAMREQVMKCYYVQNERYKGTDYISNGNLDDNGIERFCNVSEAGKKMLSMAYENMSLTMRAYGKILKISRTVADLEQSEIIDENHIAEALTYRASI